MMQQLYKAYEYKACISLSDEYSNMTMTKRWYHQKWSPVITTIYQNAFPYSGYAW